uniref:N-acetyltransferase domain-containing protein n=1 Tax=uncultured Bacillota bacterium TaxID=344338 RepID=A0A650EMH9_9FIRM|nr:hypothetical protein Firmicute1046_1230 [uncultured Firmicutes bacterium]
MEKFTISQAQNDADIQTIGALADEIWHEHYANILQPEQIDYMVEKFQSPSAIGNDIRQNGYLYYLAYAGKAPAGYCAIHPEEDGKTIFLSKIYVKREYRGKGLATQFLQTVLSDETAQNCQKLWLTVNKNNAGSIAAYEKLGFSVEETMVTDIGMGFVMDDYKMSRFL